MKNVRIVKKYTFWIFVYFICYILMQFLWLSRDQSYLVNDSHFHLLDAFQLNSQIVSGSILNIKELLSALPYHRWHGLGVSYLTALLLFIINPTQDAAILFTNSIYFAILLAATYGIGKIIIARRLGFIAAIFVGLFPIVATHFRVYLLDLPLTAIVTFALWLLLKSHYFSRLKYVLLFAVVCGYGMLIKFNFVAFLIGPTLYCIGKIKYRRAFLYVLGALSVVVCMTFAFLHAKWLDVFMRYYECSWFNDVYSEQQHSLIAQVEYWLRTTLSYCTWYMYELPANVLSWILTLPGILGCVLILLSKKIHDKAIYYLCAGIPLFFLVFVFHNPAILRYTMPLVSLYALCVAYFLHVLWKYSWGKMVTIIICVAAFLQFDAITTTWLLQPQSLQNLIPNNTASMYRNSDEPRPFSPGISEWPIDDIYAALARSAGTNTLPFALFSVDHMPDILNPLEFESTVRNKAYVNYAHSVDEESLYSNTHDISSLLLQSNYLMMLRENRDYTGSVSSLIQQNIRLLRADPILKRFVGNQVGSFESSTGEVLEMHTIDSLWTPIDDSGEQKFLFAEGIFRFKLDELHSLYFESTLKEGSTHRHLMTEQLTLDDPTLGGLRTISIIDSTLSQSYLLKSISDDVMKLELIYTDVALQAAAKQYFTFSLPQSISRWAVNGSAPQELVPRYSHKEKSHSFGSGELHTFKGYTQSSEVPRIMVEIESSGIPLYGSMTHNADYREVYFIVFLKDVLKYSKVEPVVISFTVTINKG